MTTLFDNPLSRATDPPASRSAGRKISASDKRMAKAMTLTNAVKRFPNRTMREVCTYANLDYESYHKRAKDAESAGWIVRGPERECEVTGHRAATWKVVNDVNN